MRLHLVNGGVRVGGYVGNNGGTLWLADELSGEVLEIPHSTIEDFDVVKYSRM